ncbi:MGMT family protein [Reinekea forsetii]|nr:MGMT family protein [Reinekea forsetii]
MNDKTIFYQTLASIPEGYYTSYGAIAQLCGVHVRQIQAWLRTLPEGSNLPWFRIINSQRKITQHSGSLLQHQLLAKEGLIPNERGKFPIEYYWPNESP